MTPLHTSCPRSGPFFLILLVGSLAGGAAAQEEQEVFRLPGRAELVTATESGRVDLCLACHQERPDRKHGREVLGCAACHLGNPLAGDAPRAHRGMVRNPGELRYVERTCGQAGCHPTQAEWVRNSLMATNRGIISTLRFYWEETPDLNENISVEQLKKTGKNSLALDYYRKLCGSCHLWVERGTLPGFLTRKGGGCTACHNTPAGQDVAKKQRHPSLTRDVPMENCVRCHNRSGRIGLSYQGLYESEGYGTPFEEGDFTSQQLEDGRFYSTLPADVHHQGGLVCVDCHTQKETMGDGKHYAHFEDQLEVQCRTCHGDRETLSAIAEAAKSPAPAGIQTDAGSAGNAASPPPKLQVEAKDGEFFLAGRIDKKLHPLKAPDPVACGHETHRRLSCQACHSTWEPQCYGCHVRMDRSRTQLDKVSVQETPGRWQEFRSFIRHECPPLGIMEPRKEQPGGLDDKARAQEGGEVVVLAPG